MKGIKFDNSELYESLYNNQRSILRKMVKVMGDKDTKLYEKLYNDQRKLIKRLIKSMGKQELVNILQEMKIISKFKDDGYCEPLKELNSSQKSDKAKTKGEKGNLSKQLLDKAKLQAGLEVKN